MPLIKAQVSDEIFIQLQKFYKENNFDSMAQCIRETLERGLAVEESLISSPKNLSTTTAAWLCEVRLLLRYLVENTPQHPRALHRDILEAYKQKSEAYVASLQD